MSNKIGELQHSVRTHNIDVAVVTETKYGQSTLDSETLEPGYTVIRKDRNEAGGDVAIWAKSELSVTQLTQVACGSHEVLWASVSTHDGRRTVLGAIYRPGSCAETDTSLMEYLDSVLDNVRHLGSNLILAGDFNVHNAGWLQSTETTPAGESLEVLCATHQLAQHVPHATRGSNTLDLIISNFSTPVSTSIHAPLGRSDHAVVVSNFQAVDPRREPTTFRKVWRNAYADWNRLRAHFR